MQAYASRTGTRRNLEALRAAGWRILISATGVWRNEGFPYAIDNGAWTAYNQQTKWDGVRFMVLVKRMGRDADWVVIPDIVAAGLRSLEFSQTWLPYVLRYTHRGLLAVQDGMEPHHVEHLLGDRVGIFVGGSTEWKLQSMATWGELAKKTGCHLHVGRVNTAKRIFLCQSTGVDSFDGTSVSRFAKTLPKLDHARKQQDLFA